jgi:hypothetical protein
MLSQNQICQPIKKMTTRITCPRCNKPNMSKKNINAHYKAGCSGIWDQFTKPKEKKEPKEKKPRQPRKSRNKKITFSCSDFIDFTNWIIEEQVILNGDDEDQFHECYQLFRSSAAETVGLKNNQEPPEPPMIIKITYPWTIQKSVEESVEEQVQESVEEQVEEQVEFGDIYPAFEEDSFKDENEMVLHENVSNDEIIKKIADKLIQEHVTAIPEIQIKIIDPLPEIIQETVIPLAPAPEERIKGPIKLSKLRKPKKEKSVEQDVCNALNWCLFNNNNKPKIDPEDEFFLEDKNIENEFPDNTEEHIQLRLNKFMERWSDTEIKNYSNNQKKRINHIIRKEKSDLNGIFHITNIELYKNKYQYNFIIRNLINFIKVKLDQLDDEGLSQEESHKKFNQFDKNKILEKYKDKFNHWDDRARNTYELPKTCEWTITTREREPPTDESCTQCFEIVEYGLIDNKCHKCAFYEEDKKQVEEDDRLMREKGFFEDEDGKWRKVRN